MKKYTYKEKTYTSIWELRRACPQFVFPDSAGTAQLARLGIAVVETPDPVPDPVEVAKQEQEMQIRQIDAETSSAIMAGFDYTLDNVKYHFSYDSFDQQNFADTANACLMSKSGIDGLPVSVTWNAYKEDGSLVRLALTADQFLALYAGGALAHKATCMEEGGIKKAALLAGD